MKTLHFLEHDKIKMSVITKTALFVICFLVMLNNQEFL